MSIYCVIPTIWKNGMINNLVSQLISQDEFSGIYIMDNTALGSLCSSRFDHDRIFEIPTKGLGIYEQWNLGLKNCLSIDDCESIVILNDDIIIKCENFLTRLTKPLSDELVWASCANYDYRENEFESINVIGTYKDGGFAGFAFSVKANAYSSGLSFFDERYNWWFGDDDFVNTVHSNNRGTVMSIQANIEHIDGGSQSTQQYTPEFNFLVEKDRALYLEKWHG